MAMDGESYARLTREIFGNVPAASKLLFYCLAGVSTGVFCWGVWRRVRLWRIGKPEAALPNWKTAAANLWQFALLQRRVRGGGPAGVAHIALFGGFMLLFAGTTLIAVEHGLAWLLGRPATDPVFHKGIYYAVYEPVLELAGLALLAGCAFFVFRRGTRSNEVSHDWRDWMVLALLVSTSLTGYLLEALRIVHEQSPFSGLSFVGALLANGIGASGLAASDAGKWHLAVWWLHAVLVFAFIAILPFTRLLHAVAATVRLALGIQPLGALRPVSIQEVEATGELGVGRVEQFTKRQLLELDACVSCGRCEQACPAFEAGKPLSPRNVVQDIRRELERIGNGRRAWSPKPSPNGSGMTSSPSGSGPELAGDVVSAEAVWSCTTCSACVDVCPTGVSPLGFLTDLRRHLVAGTQLSGSPAKALQKAERTGNPWGMPARQRMRWAEGLNVPTVEENPDYDVLYWVGCAAAYDNRLQKIARSVAKLLRAAGVNFAVLGNSESCTGETARRMGDELLFQELASRNIEAFKRFDVDRPGRRIVSHCPHCVNSFRQDYSQLGARLDTVHHTEFLMELIRSGRLSIPPAMRKGPAAGMGVTTYHDPCYLARVQGVTAAPRELLALAPGAGALAEMPRRERQTACCGAGGGRIWFDDAPNQRTGRSRVAEALGTGAATLAVSCPFCLLMSADGVAAHGGGMRVRDVAEMLADSLPEEAPQSGS